MLALISLAPNTAEADGNTMVYYKVLDKFEPDNVDRLKVKGLLE